MISVSGTSETSYYYVQGLIGSTIALTDQSGTIVEGYTYDAYGNTIINTSAGTDGDWLTPDGTTATGSAYNNPYLYAGRRFDDETGLYYYRFRYYNPYIGRFMSPDPLLFVDGMNVYAYVGNNPVSWNDPWGLAKSGNHNTAPGWDSEDFEDLDNFLDNTYTVVEGIGRVNGAVGTVALGVWTGGAATGCTGALAVVGGATGGVLVIDGFTQAGIGVGQTATGLAGVEWPEGVPYGLPGTLFVPAGPDATREAQEILETAKAAYGDLGPVPGPKTGLFTRYVSGPVGCHLGDRIATSIWPEYFDEPSGELGNPCDFDWNDDDWTPDWSW